MYITVTESLPGEGNSGNYSGRPDVSTFVRSTKVRRDKMPEYGKMAELERSLAAEDPDFVEDFEWLAEYLDDPRMDP